MKLRVTCIRHDLNHGVLLSVVQMGEAMLQSLLKA